MIFRLRTTLAALLLSTSPAYADTLEASSLPNWPDGFTPHVDARAAQPRIVAERVPGVERLPEILVVARRPHPLHPIRGAARGGSPRSPEG
jgi:hypothetical protein